MIGPITFVQQILIGRQRILQGGRIRRFRRETIGSAKHLHAAFYRQHGSEALGVFQIPGGESTAVKV